MIDHHSIDMVLPDNCTKRRLGGPGLRRVKMKVRSDIHIRRAESRDAPTIAILLAEAFAEYQSLYELFGTPLFTMEKLLLNLSSQNRLR